MRLPYVDMMLWIARAWVYCDLGRHAECQDAVKQGLELCERIDSLPFYRLTLRCAGLWSLVESKTLDRSILVSRLVTFKADCERWEVRQFVKVAKDLLSRA